MTDEQRICISCRSDIISMNNSVEFKCPACGEKIIRCGKCRKLMVKWKCRCGFEGP